MGEAQRTSETQQTDRVLVGSVGQFAELRVRKGVNRRHESSRWKIQIGSRKQITNARQTLGDFSVGASSPTSFPWLLTRADQLTAQQFASMGLVGTEGYIIREGGVE